MATVIERLAVSITANYKGLTKGLRASQKSVERFGRDMEKSGRRLTVAGTAMIAPLVLATREYLQFGDTVQKMAIRTGFGTQALSELSFAADISGADISGLEKATRRMSKAVIDAQDGMTTYVRAFDRIGLSAADLQNMSIEDAFFAVGKAIASTTDPMIRAAAAQDIFGRAGTSLLPLFESGADGIAKLRQEARDLGVSLTQLAADRAAKAQDALTRMKFAVKGVALSIGTQLAPMIIGVTDRVKSWTKTIRTMVENNQAAIASYVKLALGTLAVGVALLAVAGAAKLVALLLSPAGIIGVAAAGILLLLDATGKVNLGWTDFINNIRLGGIRVGTYMTATALVMMQTWNTTLAYMNEQWTTFKSIISGDDGKVTFGSFFKGLTAIATDSFLGIIKFFVNAFKEATKWIGKGLDLLPGDTAKRASDTLKQWGADATQTVDKITRDQEAIWQKHYDSMPNNAAKLVDDLEGIKAKLAEANAPLAAALNDIFTSDIRDSESKRGEQGWFDKFLSGMKVSGGMDMPEMATASNSFQSPGALTRGSSGAFSAVAQQDYRERNAQLTELRKQTGTQSDMAETLNDIRAELRLQTIGADDVGEI